MADLMSAGEVARRLGLSRERVWQLAVSGGLAYLPSPLGRLFPRDQVERVARSRERPHTT